MPSGRRPNANYLPGQGGPYSLPINSTPPYANLENPIEREFFLHYYYMLFSYATHMFKWNDLPDGIPSKFIEYTLATQGYGAFANWMGKLVFARCTLSGPLNMYWEPEEFNMYATNGLNFRTSSKEAVIAYNNNLRTPTAPYLANYAARMAQAEAFIYVNINANKTPVIISVRNENQRLTLMNAYAKFEGNTPVIFVLDDMGLEEDVKSIDTGAEWKVNDAMKYRQQIWDDAMLFLGIQNVYNDKKERLVVAEATGANQQIMLARAAMLEARQTACEQVNDMFGTNISVEFTLQDEMAQVVQEGGENIDYNAVNGPGGNNESV